MAIVDKIHQENLEFIRFDKFMSLLSASLSNTGVNGFDMLPKLLDKGLLLRFTEAGYVYEEQIAFKGDVKCALIRVERKLSDSGEPESVLYEKEILKTQGGLEKSLGRFLVKRSDVKKIYSELQETKYPWLLTSCPENHKNWGWFSVRETPNNRAEIVRDDGDSVVVYILGREALPIWTIPYVTNWDISVDMLLKRLISPKYKNEATFPTAFELDSNMKVHPIPRSEFISYERDFISYSEDVSDDDDALLLEKRTKWRMDCVEVLMSRKSCYLWLEDFTEWLDWYNEFNNTSDSDNPIVVIPTEDGQGFCKQEIELYLTPWLPLEHALYLENVQCKQFPHQKTNSEIVSQQKEISEIAASRITDLYKSPKSKYTVEDLLNKKFEDLLKPNLHVHVNCQLTGIPKPNAYFVELYAWERMLIVERRISASERDKVRVESIDARLNEINQHLDDYSNAVNVSPKPTIPDIKNVVKTIEAAKTKKRESELHHLIWKVRSFLIVNKKRHTALDVWREIERNYEQHDTGKIIDSVQDDTINWCSIWGNAGKLKKTTLSKTITSIKKNPRFKK